MEATEQWPMYEITYRTSARSRKTHYILRFSRNSGMALSHAYEVMRRDCPDMVITNVYQLTDEERQAVINKGDWVKQSA